MAVATISHASIGTIKASTVKDGVLQFLGLQYATLADRFSSPVLKGYESDGTFDATRLGPQALSISPNADPEFGLIQHSLEYDKTALTQSGTECLCLNITVPTESSGSLDAGRQLPVFVFIHGGGFMVGSNAYPQYDMARFVRLSAEIGKPCIAVTINYRLGAPGFLTSSAMRAAGYKPNNGLRDQRVALQWLQKHLPGFGGDPANITLAGESAGGISVCYHLFSEQALFKRMVSMSGTMLLMPPISLDEAEENYDSALKSLGLAEDTAINQLLRMDGSELVGRIMKSGTRLVLVEDGEICPTSFSFASMAEGNTSIAGKQWCESAMVGDCQFDGNIQALRLMHKKKDIAKSFCSIINDSFNSHSGLADRLLSAYGIVPDSADDEALFKILQVANDINFYIPSRLLASALSAEIETYQYRFNEPNPWDGPWKGHATHILDIAFLLQNFNEYLDDEQSSVAVSFAEDFVAFIHGSSPWTAGADVAKVLGPKGKVEVVDDEPQKTGRRRVILELGEQVGFDVLNDAFNAFMRAPPPV